MPQNNFRYIGIMNKATLLFALILSSVYSFAAPPTQLSLSKAIQQNMITIVATATGQSYNEQGLKLKIKNNGSLRFNLMINEGVIFAPDSAGYQPLILVGGERLYMNKLAEGEVMVQTFCANSALSAPYEGLSYTYLKDAGDTLKKVLNFMHKNRMYGDLGQSAVWFFTNDHDLEEVYDGNNDFMSKKLLEYIISVTGRTMPEYHVQPTIADEPGQEVYNPKTLKIFAKYEYLLEEPKTLTLGIFNEAGEMIQPVFENRRYGKAGHRFRVEFEAKDVQAGKYYIRLKSGDEVLKETMVEVQ